MKIILASILTFISLSAMAGIDCRKDQFTGDRKFCEEKNLFGCKASSCRAAVTCVGKALAELQGERNAVVEFVELRSYGTPENFIKIDIKTGNKKTSQIVVTTQTTFPKNVCHAHALK